MGRKKVKKFVATYIGPQRVISISPGIGKIFPDKPFEVDENIANTLKLDPNFRVEEKYEYVEI